MSEILNFILPVLVVLWGIFGVVGAVISIIKRFSFSDIGCLFILFSPIIIYVGFFASAAAGPILLAVSLLIEGRKRCPFCKTKIPGSANMCPNCNSSLGGPSSMMELLMAYGLAFRDSNGNLYLNRINLSGLSPSKNIDLERRVFDMLRSYKIPARNAGEITRLMIRSGLNLEEAKHVFLNSLDKEPTMEKAIGFLESGVWISEKWYSYREP